jgi:hypothetical protein
MDMAASTSGALKPAWNGLTNLWCQLTAGGQPVAPQFYELFGDPLFVGIDVWPLDHPTTFNRLFPGGDYGKWGLGQSYLFTAEPGVGLPSGPPIPKDEPNDYPWDPSGGRADPGFDILILNDQLEWTGGDSAGADPTANALHGAPGSQRSNIEKAVAAGKGFVVFHHALGDNNTWPWWYQQVTGGLLVLDDTAGMKKTQVKRGASFEVRPVGDHPVLTGVRPFTVEGETAIRGMWQSPHITPLLETDSPDSDRVVAWTGVSPTCRVVCIQPGASAATCRNPNFRRLVRNAILWSAGRLGEVCSDCKA